MGKENRKSIRRVIRQPAMILNRDRSEFGLCTILDISATGAKLKAQDPANVPEEFVMLLSTNAQVHRRCKVTWRSETEIGVIFVVATVRATLKL
jgi:hypothetical protein